MKWHTAPVDLAILAHLSWSQQPCQDSVQPDDSSQQTKTDQRLLGCCPEHLAILHVHATLVEQMSIVKLCQDHPSSNQALLA